MCGIVGRAGSLGHDDERVFKVMLLLDYFRGQDSTGVAAISKKGFQTTLKVADDPIMLFRNNDYEATVAGVSDAIWIGHNRAATVGVTTRANAHPFTCDHITGVHNGTLTKESFREIKEWIKEDYDTDSQTIYQNIADHGVDDTISRLQGAWALVWWNERDQTLNMIRNDQRPLYWCETVRGGTRLLSWASEFEMIAAAREMSGAKKKEEIVRDEEGFAYFPLEIDTLHTWTLEQILAGDFTPAKREIKGKPPAPKVVGFTAGSSAGSNVYKSSYTTKEDVYESSVEEGEESSEDLILGQYTETEWEEMAGYGCGVCGADIDKDADGLLVCTNEGVVLCPKCSEVEATTIINSYSTQLQRVL